jgi:hypothetical protein
MRQLRSADRAAVLNSEQKLASADRLGATVKALAISTVGVICLALASSAFARTVVSPRDGDVVESQPAFVLDEDAPGSSLTVEVSRSPDLLFAGHRVGWFVDPVESSTVFFDEPPLNVVRWHTGRLHSGSYYWRSLIEAYDGSDPIWSPVLTFTVRDEPIRLEGWRVVAQRLSERGRCERLRLRGSVVFDDNEPSPTAALTLSVRASGKTKARLKRNALYSGERFDGVVCVRNRRVTVTPYLRDTGEHVTRGPSRTVTARR